MAGAYMCGVWCEFPNSTTGFMALEKFKENIIDLATIRTNLQSRDSFTILRDLVPPTRLDRDGVAAITLLLLSKVRPEGT